MAIGKSSKNKGRKGGKKKQVDSFARKEWYDVIAPKGYDAPDQVGKTPVNRSQGLKLSSDSLKGRVFEANLADIDSHNVKDREDEQASKKIRLQVVDIRGSQCLTDYAGMEVTRDSLMQSFKKWFTAIKVWTEAKTMDGFVVRVFAITFTRKSRGQQRQTTYAKTNQRRAIRSMLKDHLKSMVTSQDLAGVMKRLKGDIGNKVLHTKLSVVRPVINTTVIKVKVVKRPAIDPARVAALHTGIGAAFVNKEGLEQEQNLLTEVEN